MNSNRWGLFDGGRINRALPKTARADAKNFAKQALEKGALVLPFSSGNRIYMQTKLAEPEAEAEAAGLKLKSIQWLTKDTLEETFQLRYEKETISFSSLSELQEERAELNSFGLIYLGREVEEDGKHFFAVDMTNYELADGDHRNGSEDVLYTFEELRSFVKSNHDLLGTKQAASVSRAGYALALGNWSRGLRFCPSCSSPIHPVQIGTRKECESCGKKQYPRLDPVCIMLVTSEDEKHVLLASPRYASGRMLTCLAGFIEQCETIEEAVVREVYEETGVVVDQVEILGSQPWPLGRSGACELMIGCIAKAKSNPATSELCVDEAELNSASWVPLGLVEEKLAKSKAWQKHGKSSKPSTPLKKREESSSPSTPKETWIVPPYAIAHHLIEFWIRRKSKTKSALKVSRL